MTDVKYLRGSELSALLLHQTTACQKVQRVLFGLYVHESVGLCTGSQSLGSAYTLSIAHLVL